MRVTITKNRGRSRDLPAHYAEALMQWMGPTDQFMYGYELGISRMDSEAVAIVVRGDTLHVVRLFYVGDTVEISVDAEFIAEMTP